MQRRFVLEKFRLVLQTTHTHQLSLFDLEVETKWSNLVLRASGPEPKMPNPKAKAQQPRPGHRKLLHRTLVQTASGQSWLRRAEPNPDLPTGAIASPPPPPLTRIVHPDAPSFRPESPVSPVIVRLHKSRPGLSTLTRRRAVSHTRNGLVGRGGGWGFRVLNVTWGKPLEQPADTLKACPALRRWLYPSGWHQTVSPSGRMSIYSVVKRSGSMKPQIPSPDALKCSSPRQTPTQQCCRSDWAGSRYGKGVWV